MDSSQLFRRSSQTSAENPVALENGDLQMQNLPRPSTETTETQIRNGYRRSTLPDHGDRILEDLSNGK